MNEKETLKCEDIAEDNLYDMEMAYTRVFDTCIFKIL